jgi:hypothetical protein
MDRKALLSMLFPSLVPVPLGVPDCDRRLEFDILEPNSPALLSLYLHVLEVIIIAKVLVSPSGSKPGDS